MSDVEIEVRGIQSTALTRFFLDADGFRVVNTSDAIDGRFDEEFGSSDDPVKVETTDSRSGLAIYGEDAVEVGGALTDLGIDVFSTTRGLSPGSILWGRIEDTMSSGAFVDVGGFNVFLPFSKADGRVEDGDVLPVRVIETRSPWTTNGDNPVVSGGLKAGEAPVELLRGFSGVRVESHDSGLERELSRTTELLLPDLPDGWGVLYGSEAADLDMGELGERLESAAVDAERVESEFEGEGRPGDTVIQGEETVWVWFGKGSAGKLDKLRDEVLTTVPGHHRIKSLDGDAAKAVDFAEKLGISVSDGFGETLRNSGNGDVEEAVWETWGPRVGDDVYINHHKPDGGGYSLGRGRVMDRDVSEGLFVVSRKLGSGGSYDELSAEKEKGDRAVTTFREGRWSYETEYRDADGDLKGRYVNVCTPLAVDPTSVEYVDLYVDVVIEGQGEDKTVEVVDRDELKNSVKTGSVSQELAEKAVEVAESISDGEKGM
ncbi:MAG: DUF402 domain-containing protein [Halobacteria archaeon]